MKKIKITKDIIDRKLEEIQIDLIEGKIKERTFNMENFSGESCLVSNRDCGTAHCIGGWLSVYLGLVEWNEYSRKFVIVSHINPINNEFVTWPKGMKERFNLLFYPSEASQASNGYVDDNSGNWKWMKRKHAVKAIQNFRDGANDPWMNVKEDVKNHREG